MIPNAKDMTIDQVAPGLPDVSDAVRAFLLPIQIGIIQKAQIDGYANEVPTYYDTFAAVYPLTAEDLRLKPEGQRSWKWQKLWMLSDIIMTTDDKVIIAGDTYRVMEKSDNSQYGYFDYTIMQDYEENTQP
jgi:hypothetical protein